MARLQPAEKSEFNEGICGNCLSASTCTNRQHSGAPVLFCEEYQCIDEPKKVSGGSIDYRQYVNPVPDTSHGLCCNCDYKSDCERNRELGTVLYCEEYA